MQDITLKFPYYTPVKDSEDLKCVKREECRLKCIKEDGVQYYEGDVIEKTDCQIWY